MYKVTIFMEKKTTEDFDYQIGQWQETLQVVMGCPVFIEETDLFSKDGDILRGVFTAYPEIISIDQIYHACADEICSIHAMRHQSLCIVAPERKGKDDG